MRKKNITTLDVQMCKYADVQMNYDIKMILRDIGKYGFKV
jgi:hypothetical protein